MAKEERLAILRNRIVNQIKKKEAELKDLHRKLAAVDEVYNLLIEEEDIKERSEDIKAAKDKYKNMGLQDAILDCINNGPQRPWTRPDIIKVLRQNSIRTKSPNPKNFYSVVATTLARLVQQKKIAEGVGKRGKIFKKVEAASDQGRVIEMRQSGT